MSIKPMPIQWLKFSDPKTGEPWSILIQLLNPGWSAHKVLIEVRNSAMRNIRMGGWANVIGAVGRTKMYLATVPQSKDTAEHAAIWLSNLVMSGAIRHFRGLFLIRQLPFGPPSIVVEAYLVTRETLLGLHFEAVTEGKQWHFDDTKIQSLDAAAVNMLASNEPILYTFEPALGKLARWMD